MLRAQTIREVGEGAGQAMDSVGTAILDINIGPLIEGVGIMLAIIIALGLVGLLLKIAVSVVRAVLGKPE